MNSGAGMQDLAGSGRDGHQHGLDDRGRDDRAHGRHRHKRLATIRTSNAGETREAGRELARVLRPGDVVLVEGDLGAGKTTFVQGLAQGLGVIGPVTSPTFTLLRVLQCGADGSAAPGQGAPRQAAPGQGIRSLLHADIYRLDNLQEVLELGLPELLDDAAVAAIEWGDAAVPVLGEVAFEVRIEQDESKEAGEDDRLVIITGSERDGGCCEVPAPVSDPSA